MIAVLVDHALAIALQIAVALQPLVEIGRIGRIARRHRRIDDLDAAAELDPERFRRFAHATLAAAQQRGAKALMHERRRGADHLLFLAFGKDDAALLPAQALEHALEYLAACATATGISEISRGSNGTGMM